MSRRLSWVLSVAVLLVSGSALAQDWRREPTFGATNLTSGFVPDPAAYPLTAGGGSDPVDVSALGLHDVSTGQPCGQSFITRSPDFRFYFTPGADFDFMRFYVVTQNGADATLLINQPDASWRCNDDSFGTLMPAVDFSYPQAGQYDIWVGTYDASSHNPATFYITELEQNNPGTAMGMAPTTPQYPPTTPQTPPTTPQMPTGQVGVAGLATTSWQGNFAPLTVNAGFMPDPMQTTGTSGGTVGVSGSGIYSVNGGSCSGFVAQNPDHILTLGTYFNYLRIDAVSSNGGDTTMVVQDPMGNWWCSDDDGGYPNPRIAGQLQPGTYRVWIGSYASGEYNPYNLSVTGFQP